MAHLIEKSALVAEIERRKHKLLDNIIFENDKEWVVRTVHQLNRIILFLNTLEVKEAEEEPVSNDIEAEFVLYLKHKFNIPQEGNKLKTDGWRPGPYDILDIAKHFAQWQKEKMITKACEWIREHKDYVATEDNGISGWIPECFIEEFKKAMEE